MIEKMVNLHQYFKRYKL